MHIELTQAIVHELLDYNPATGALTWKHRARKWFPTDRSYISWNAAWVGKAALAARTKNGYLRGGIFSKLYSAHRVVWLWVTGSWPNSELDHKNRIRDDNRFVNLREVTHQQNGQNKSQQCNNTSGTTGVTYHKNRFEARITINDRRYHLGSFTNFADAAAVRKAAERRYGFSPGHGRRYLRRTQDATQ